MRISEREKRDMFLLAAIVLLGILLMFIAGQFAIRLLPRWSVPSDMGSKIDPNSAGAVVAQAGFAPLRPEILTPPAWQNSFLTPLAEFGPLNEVPVVIIAPATARPTLAATATSGQQATQAPSATPISSTPTPFPTNTLVVVFPTWTFTAPPPTSVPPTSVPTETLVPSETPIPPTETPIPPTETPVTPSATPITPIPTDDWPPEIEDTPDDDIFNLGQGGQLTFAVTINVDGNPDWDLVLYEMANPPGIHMDWIVLSVSQDGYTWYTIFNWGDDVADTNSTLNINGPLGGDEADNRLIDAIYLYPNGVYGNTGIAINVDAILSMGAPIGTYNYLRIYSPLGGNDTNCDIDAIQILP